MAIPFISDLIHVIGHRMIMHEDYHMNKIHIIISGIETLVLGAAGVMGSQWLAQRDKAEEEMQKSEIYLNTMGDSLLVLDRERRVIESNNAANTLFGYSREELAGLAFEDLFLEKEHKKHYTEMGNAVTTGKIKLFDTIIVKKDREEIPVSISETALYNANGELGGFVGVLKDITVRKRAEETLQQRTYELGERVKELNCLYDISNLFENPDISLEDIFQSVVNIIPPSWQYPEITCSRIILEDEEFKTVNFKETEWKQSSETFVTGKRIGTLEVFYLEERPEIYEGPFLKEERNLIDEITNRLGTIIEWKLAESALRESEEKYRVITDSALDAIIEIGPDGKVTHWNPAAEKIFGYTKDDIMEKVVHDYLMPDKFKEQYEIGFEKFRETGTGPVLGQVLELTAIHKDGNEFPIEMAVSLINKQGQYWASAIIRDITNRKLAEEVSKKADALEITNVVLKNFVGDALGNLISPIYGRIQMIIEIRDNIDVIKRDLKITETGLAEFLTGINTFREYFRFGEHPMKERSSTDISHILSSLLSGQTLETYGKDKFPIDPKVKLRFTYDPKQEGALGLKELPYVVGPESDIATAIQETLINAIESYEEESGDVVISAKKEKDNLILEIADQGRGMSPDETEKSQLPFFKVLGVKGSARFGLGAYIANESAKHCGGAFILKVQKVLAQQHLSCLR